VRAPERPHARRVLEAIAAGADVSRRRGAPQVPPELERDGLGWRVPRTTAPRLGEAEAHIYRTLLARLRAGDAPIEGAKALTVLLGWTLTPTCGNTTSLYSRLARKLAATPWALPTARGRYGWGAAAEEPSAAPRLRVLAGGRSA
jgi:hypothetical protein